MQNKYYIRKREEIHVKGLFDAVLEHATSMEIEHYPFNDKKVKRISCIIDDGNKIQFEHWYGCDDYESWTITAQGEFNLFHHDSFKEYMKSKGLLTGRITIIEADGTDWKYSTFAFDEENNKIVYYR